MITKTQDCEILCSPDSLLVLRAGSISMTSSTKCTILGLRDRAESSWLLQLERNFLNPLVTHYSGINYANTFCTFSSSVRLLNQLCSEAMLVVLVQHLLQYYRLLGVPTMS